MTRILSVFNYLKRAAFALLLCGGAVHAQLPDTLWTRIYDAELDDSCSFFPAIAATPDTGYVVAGDFCEGTIANNAAAFKCNSNGDLQWMRVIGTEHSDGFLDMTVASDNCLLFSGYGSLLGSLMAMKLTQAGDSIWSYWGRPGGSENTKILEALDGTIAVLGDFISPENEDFHGAGLLRLSGTGDSLSVSTYLHPVWMRRTIPRDLTEAWTSGFVVATSVWRPQSIDYVSAYIIRTNEVGDSLWTRTWPVGDERVEYTPTAICKADSGNYFISVEEYDYTDGTVHSLVVKMNDLGDTLWTRPNDFPGLVVGGAGQLLPDPRGGILVSTTAADQVHGGSVALLFKIDLEGNVLWSGTVAGLRGPFCRALDLAIAADGGYYWLLSDQIYPRVVRLVADTTTDAVPEPLTPLPLIHLEQNYPNPFNSTTTISFSLPRTMHVTLRVYDLTGREVGTLVDSNEEVGEHQIQFDANTLPSGVYFYQLRAGQFSETRKLLLIR